MSMSDAVVYVCSVSEGTTGMHGHGTVDDMVAAVFISLATFGRVLVN